MSRVIVPKSHLGIWGGEGWELAKELGKVQLNEVPFFPQCHRDCLCFVMTRQPKYHQACIGSWVWILSLLVPLVFKDAGSGQPAQFSSQMHLKSFKPFVGGVAKPQWV